MATAFGSISTASIDSGAGDASQLTITKPSGTASGDLLIAIFGYGVSNNELAKVTLSGWTEIDQLGVDNKVAYNSLFKVAGGSEPANYTFANAAGDIKAILGAIIRVTGAGFSGAGNILGTDSDSSLSGSGSETFTGGVTPGGSNSLLIMGGVGGEASVVAFDGAAFAVANSNPTWTERADFNDSDSLADVSMGIATSIFSVGTATGDYTMSVNADPTNLVGFILSVKENTDISLTGSVGTLTLQGNVGSVAADANVTGSVGTLTLQGNVGTVATTDSKWSNTDKSSAPSWVNENKS